MIAIYMDNKDTTNLEVYKSYKLDNKNINTIKDFVGRFPNVNKGCQAIGISRNTYERLLFKKSCGFETYNKLQTIINA